MKKISILNFAKEVISHVGFGTTKYINWGQDNLFPQQLIEYYEKIPAHSAAVDFIEQLIIGQGLNNKKIDYWMLKKLISDYLLFGGLSLEVIKLRNGEKLYNYIDISKLRYTEDSNKILYCDDWSSYKQKIIKSDISDGNNNGIYIFKNHKSKNIYPKPYSLSLVDIFDTYKNVIEYHKNNAANGWSASYHIKIVGVNDQEERDDLEKSLLGKFTRNGQKFILSFSDSDVDGVKIDKIEGNDDDKKFDELIKFLRDEIIIGHKITSPNLIGVNTSGNGFNKTEYEESLNVFKENVIEGFRNELLYSLKELTGITDLVFLDKDEKEDINIQEEVDKNVVDEEKVIADENNN